MARVERPSEEQAKRTPVLRDPAMQGFFESLGRALVRGQGEAVAEHWDVPALVLSDEGSHAVSALEQVASFFSCAKEQYTSRGITDTRPELVRVEWLTARVAIVQVRWLALDAGGVERGEERSTYTLHKDDAGKLKIRAVVTQGAKEQPVS